MSTDLHTLSGAYVLHALSDEERDEFARHLEGCEACRDEVRELSEVVARMGASEAAVPPADLRTRVLAAVERQPQLPPKVTPLERVRARRWKRWLPAAAAVVILAVGAAFGISQIQHDHHNVAGPSVSQVFEAPDARTVSVRTAEGGRLRVAVSRESGRMAVATGGLHRLPDRKVYQLWAVHNGRATSVGVVEDAKAGAVMPIPAAGTTVAITVEPAGGSKAPTTKPIVEVDPAAV